MINQIFTQFVSSFALETRKERKIPNVNSMILNELKYIFHIVIAIVAVVFVVDEVFILSFLFAFTVTLLEFQQIIRKIV